MNRSLLREALIAACLAAAGTLLSMLAVYAGTGLLDGFGDWDLHRIGRRFRRYLPYTLLGACLAGPLLRAFYARLLKTPSAWALLLGIPRAFIHFIFLAVSMLLVFAAAWAWLGLVWLAWKLRLMQRDKPPTIAEGINRTARTGFAVPVWFMVFPFTAMGAISSSIQSAQPPKRPPDTVWPNLAGLQRRMFRLLPWLLAAVILLVGAESEDTGARVDPYWLTLFASCCVSDFLIVAFQVVPALRAREIAAQAPGP